MNRTRAVEPDAEDAVVAKMVKVINPSTGDVQEVSEQAASVLVRKQGFTVVTE